jgi:hypothetical protein
MQSRPATSEHLEQVAVIEWCEAHAGKYPGITKIYATPNGGSRPFREAADKAGNIIRYSPESQRLKKEGVKAGVPDLFLPLSRGGFHGLYIEMKIWPRKPEAEQWHRIDELNNDGYLAVLCYYADAAIDVLEWYMQDCPLVFNIKINYCKLIRREKNGSKERSGSIQCGDRSRRPEGRSSGQGSAQQPAQERISAAEFQRRYGTLEQANPKRVNKRKTRL